MANAAKMLGFLDLAGNWEPSLRSVICGVIGAGWGIAGFCPGPALVGLDIGLLKAIIFVAAMLAGMAVYELTERRCGG